MVAAMDEFWKIVIGFETPAPRSLVLFLNVAPDEVRSSN